MNALKILISLILKGILDNFANYRRSVENVTLCIVWGKLTLVTIGNPSKKQTIHTPTATFLR